MTHHSFAEHGGLRRRRWEQGPRALLSYETSLRISWDYTDYTDYGNDIWNGAANPVKRQTDYADYADYGNDTAATTFTKKRDLDHAGCEQQGMQSITLCEHEALPQEDRQQREPAVINGITVINRNQRNQLDVSEPSSDIRDKLPCEGDQGP